MKKLTANTITSIIGCVLSLFAMAAFWTGKLDGTMLLTVVAAGAGLIAYKNETIKGLMSKGKSKSEDA